MASNTVLLLAIFLLCGWARCQQEIASTPKEIYGAKYIFWKKSDISAWHHFFPLRALAEDRLTNLAALDAVDSLSKGLNNSLASIVVFQQKVLESAQYNSHSTNVEGCVRGLANVLDTEIVKAIRSYEDCAYDATSRLTLYGRDISEFNATNWAAYEKALKGIDRCAILHPNRESYPMLKSCAEAMAEKYLGEAKSIKNKTIASRSMDYFINTVIECASGAARSVVEKGSQLLDRLIGCGNITSPVDIADFYQQLREWQNYNIDLKEQVLEAQQIYSDEKRAVEEVMKDYYRQKKEVLDQYIAEARGYDEYVTINQDYLKDYFNTLATTSMEIREDHSCIDVAKAALDDAVASYAKQSAACYQEIVRNTTAITDEVHRRFEVINAALPSSGNPAILRCISEGYVFAPGTIRQCVRLVSSQFDVDYRDRLAEMERDMATLREYQGHFKVKDDLPCGGTSQQRLQLEGERTLYDLQRCLYVESGTTYEVTTPATTSETPLITLPSVYEKEENFTSSVS